MLDAHLACRLNNLDVVKGTYHDYEHLRQAGVHLTQALFESLHVVGLSNAIHFRHLNVCKDHLVADVAALLLHALLIHVNSNGPVDCLVALLAE